MQNADRSTFPRLLLVATWLLCGSSALAQSPQFVEVSKDRGLSFEHHNFPTPDKHLVETMGSGAAFFDYDNDGWLDVYLLNGTALGPAAKAPSPTNQLFHNKGDGSFEDVTLRAGVGHTGYAMGVAVGDIDNDGWLDLYVTNFGTDVLYRNLANGRFEEVTRKAGLGDPGWGTSTGFFDYDRDGDLDLYVARYLDYSLDTNIVCQDYEMKERSYCHPNHFAGASDLLYRNDGKGHFSDVSQAAGIANPKGKGLGVVLSDLDGDSWTDIYVANDSVGNFLYRNRQDGTFEDVTLLSGTGFSADAQPEAGMGVDASDATGDGRADIFVTNLDFESNSFYANQGGLWFEDQTFPRGLGRASLSQVGFGARFLDYDNDGDLDLFVVNGHILDNIQQSRSHLSYPQANQLYRNQQGHFSDVTGELGPDMAAKFVGRGLAVGDYDRDGDLDLLVSNCGQPAQLYENRGGNRKGWISLKLQGTVSNRWGLGAQARVRIGEQEAFYELTGGGSYLSGSDYRLHLGLGTAAQVDSLEILWPSGRKQKLENVKANQELVVKEP